MCLVEEEKPIYKFFFLRHDTKKKLGKCNFLLYEKTKVCVCNLIFFGFALYTEKQKDPCSNIQPAF